MGDPARVLGRSSRVLGLAWGVLGGAWCVLGGAWSVLGGPWGVLERPSSRFWRSLEVLGGSSGGPRRSLGGVWEAPKTEEVFSEGLGRVLGWSWGGFGALGWSLGRSWDVQMLIFR
jgi:hypothetical protein